MTGPLVIIAPDSFKESLTAVAAAEAMRRGVLAARPDAAVVSLPISDGGEGFAATLVAAGQGQLIPERITGPLGDPIEAHWGLIAGGRVAVVEMAQAAGLERVPPRRRDPTRTTTFGVGELIVAALRRGAAELLVGIGGSATNDGGLGMAQALGFVFLDKGGQPIAVPATGADLLRVARIAPPPSPPLPRALIRVACDVDNPLTGPHGAAHTFAAQKGATPEQIAALDRGLAQLAAAIARDLGREVCEVPGAGAAGGLGAGLLAFAGARLEPGAPLVLDALGLDTHLARAALVITGEGAANAQTLRGKAPWEVRRRAAARGVPTLFLAGDIAEAPPELRTAPLLQLRAIAPPGTPREESMRRAAELLEQATREAVRAALP